jgi:hypothetical protein
MADSYENKGFMRSGVPFEWLKHHFENVQTSMADRRIIISGTQDSAASRSD